MGGIGHGRCERRSQTRGPVSEHDHEVTATLHGTQESVESRGSVQPQELTMDRLHRGRHNNLGGVEVSTDSEKRVHNLGGINLTERVSESIGVALAGQDLPHALRRVVRDRCRSLERGGDRVDLSCDSLEKGRHVSERALKDLLPKTPQSGTRVRKRTTNSVTHRERRPAEVRLHRSRKQLCRDLALLTELHSLFSSDPKLVSNHLIDRDSALHQLQRFTALQLALREDRLPD